MANDAVDLRELIRLPAFAWNAPSFADGFVNVNYWRGSNRLLVPPNAYARVKRLGEYEQLYRGDLAPLSMNGGETFVSGSEFARVANTFTRLLMAYPPAFRGVDAEFDLDGLLSALFEVVLDVVRYGTGLLYSYPPVPATDLTPAVAGGVGRLDPRYWFPAGADAGAYVLTTPLLPVDGQLTQERTVGIQIMNGAAEERVYGHSPDGVNFSALQPIEGELPKTLIRHADYPVQTCALPPITDGWGTSMYEGMVRLAAELSRRMSSTSRILTRHAAPHLQAVRDDRAGNYVPVRGPDGRSELVLTNAKLDEDTQQNAFIPPAGVTRVEYLTWDGNLEASFRQREAIQDEIAAVTALPSALYGVTRGGQVPSGTSLKRQYAMTFATIEALQTMLIPRLQKAIGLAGGGDDVRIEWLNPVGELDITAVRMEVGDEDGDEDVRSGAELSANVGGADAGDDEDELEFE